MHMFSSDVTGKRLVKARGHTVAMLLSFRLSAVGFGVKTAYVKVWGKTKITGVMRV